MDGRTRNHYASAACRCRRYNCCYLKVNSYDLCARCCLAVDALHQGAPRQMTWLEDPPPWLRPAYCFALLWWHGSRMFWPRNNLAVLLRWRRHCCIAVLPAILRLIIGLLMMLLTVCCWCFRLLYVDMWQTVSGALSFRTLWPHLRSLYLHGAGTVRSRVWSSVSAVHVRCQLWESVSLPTGLFHRLRPKGALHLYYAIISSSGLYSIHQVLKEVLCVQEFVFTKIEVHSVLMILVQRSLCLCIVLVDSRSV